MAPSQELSPFAQAMRTLGRALKEQADTTSSRDMLALLLHMQDLVGLALAINLYTELGAEADAQRKELVALIPQMRAVYGGRRRLGSWQRTLDKILKARAAEYASADDEAARRQIRTQVSTSIRLLFGPPKGPPGSVKVPRTDLRASSWAALLDLGIRTATKKGRPCGSTPLPPKREVTRAILVAWSMGSNSVEAHAHARKPSSSRARKQRWRRHGNAR